MGNRDWGNWGGFDWTMWIPLILIVGTVVTVIGGAIFLLGMWFGSN